MKRSRILMLLLALAVLVGVLPMSAAAVDELPLRRSEAVVCLWNEAGSPDPATVKNPFSDVDEGDAYYPAVLWAAETGLTDGTGGGKFSPDAELDRAQLVAFLWKRAGKPDAAREEIPYSDVALNAWYAPAVRWALSEGLLDAAEAAFSPKAAVYASELQTMLARLTGTDGFLAQLSGSYIELFPEMCLDKYFPLWSEVLLPYCSSAEELSVYYQMFTTRFMSELYGDAAVEAYAEDPENALFNCFFLKDVAVFTMEGNMISGADAEGRELFRHSYHYVEDLPVTYFGMEMPISMHIYESDDAAEDAFRYFAFSDDTPAETYHLEFRYGGSKENLTNYTEGEYAYWLASAIPADYGDRLMSDCVTLFVTENLGGAEEQDAFSAIAGENGATYENLFSVILDEKYASLWHDYCAAVVGEEQADAFVQMLKGAISADVYGEEAAAAYAGSSSYAFDCWFIHDAALFTFNPDYSATVTLTDGSQQSYHYEPLGTAVMGADETILYQGMEISMATEGELYRSTEPAGEFSYLFFLPDTMETTYHLEFRYGSDPEALMGYMKGPYAYWLAAAIDADADAETVEKVIRLFCLENMDYSQHAEAALTQLADFVGTWDADLSAFGEAYENVSLYFTIDESGHGITWMNGVQTTEFEAYAYETEPGKGVYVAYDLTGFEPEGAAYAMQTDARGRTVLTLCAADGTISYVKESFAGGKGTAEDPWQIATAEQLDHVRRDLTAHYVLVNDIDLSAYENWEPIGSFQSLSDAPEDAEVPHPDYAFTGTFDGNGHTISNLNVASQSPIGAGLFGCASGTENGAACIRNFTLKDIRVSGGYLVGGAVGLQFMNCPVSDITLTGDNTLTGMQGIGGIVGTGFDLIENCTATADITVLGDDGACAGLIAGGTTMSSIKNCRVIGGNITAEGNAAWGFGAVCGAPWGAPEIADCSAIGTRITVSGEGNRLVGGLVGFGGTYGDAAPAQIAGCMVEDVVIVVSDSTDSVGGLIGGGKEMMEGVDVMSSFEIKGCSVSGTISGGRENVAPVVGDPACAVSVDCEGGMKLADSLAG